MSQSLVERMGSTRHRGALGLQQSPNNPLLSPQDLRTWSRLVLGGRRVVALPGRGSGWSPTAGAPLQGVVGPFQGRRAGGVEWGTAFCCKPVLDGTNWVSAARAASRHCDVRRDRGKLEWVSCTGRFPLYLTLTLADTRSSRGANLPFENTEM